TPKSRRNTVYLFTRFGLGHAPEELQTKLVGKFLSLLIESGDLPAKVVFYTEGVKLVCSGSPVIDQLKQFEAAGVELVICSTCLEFLGLSDQVQVGIVGGMPDILEALQKAPKVVSL
ncbi:MAG TPA: DsrE family protein, partial [Longilinea sp.]|nr:DsrE family protein [Longilinea sp.]